ncbi:hypothetical protein EZS27_014596 [termite gut metagenome]|uniref:Uncharacterized protein n=1 Tax=termite gut metagenome TaxID=433724 RepID=A0A5J4RWI0_9ZZZZ
MANDSFGIYQMKTMPMANRNINEVYGKFAGVKCKMTVIGKLKSTPSFPSKGGS